jgi:hypothetical protein
MAFTNAEKTRLRRYLGFSELYRQVETRLESQLDALPTNNPDAETQVRALLAKVDAVDTKIQSAGLENLDAAKVKDVVLLGAEQLRALRAQGRMLIRQIAITFDLEPRRDYFDEGGAMGGLLPLG